MQTRTRSKHQRTFLFLGTLALCGAQITACTVEVPNIEPDPRLGKEKRVQFSSGCSSSTAMALGSTETMSVVAAKEGDVLPMDLSPKSTAPAVIEVTPKTNDSFEMKALSIGSTNIEVWSAGARYDWLPFTVDRATKVSVESKPSVIAGGRMGLAIGDIFGACGTEKCELFGHNFMQWSAEPPASLTFLEEVENLAHYRASTMPGSGAIIGKEPSQGGELVRHSVEIVDPATITTISGQWLKKENDNESTLVVFPATVKVNGDLSVQLFGERAGKAPVPIARQDVEWTLPTNIVLFSQLEPADPYVDIFAVGDMAGSFMITAKIAILGGKEQSFVVNVTQ